jgi:hypothetical protein
MVAGTCCVHRTCRLRNTGHHCWLACLSACAQSMPLPAGLLVLMQPATNTVGWCCNTQPSDRWRLLLRSAVFIGALHKARQGQCKNFMVLHTWSSIPLALIIGLTPSCGCCCLAICHMRHAPRKASMARLEVCVRWCAAVCCKILGDYLYV